MYFDIFRILLLCGLVHGGACHSANAYEDAAREKIEKSDNKYIGKLKRATECARNVGECVVNSYEKHSGKMAAAVNKVSVANECLNTADYEKQKSCMEAVKGGYARRKEERQKKESEEAAKWRWNGEVGKEARICTKGKSKPVGVVLMVTDTKVKLEINQSGGNVFHYYSVGDQPWIDKNMVGC